MKIYLFSLLVIYLPLILLGLLLPQMSRKTLFFGVNIPEEKVDSLKGLQKKYYYYFSFSSILVYGLLTYGYALNKGELLLILGPWAFVVLLSANYYFIHRQVKALKEREGWLIDKKQVVLVETRVRPDEKAISPWWFLIPAGLCLFGLLMTMIQYPHLPEQLPGHFDGMGQVTRYDDKSLVSAFMLPAVSGGMTLMMFGIYTILSRAKISINPAKPQSSLLRGQLANRRWGVFSLVTAILLTIQLLYTQFMVLQLVDGRAMFALTILITAGILLLTLFMGIFTGQGGSRIKLPQEDQEEPRPRLVARDDDSFWKLGMFYYNPEDPTLWVEKRFGVGFTINHAHPVGKVLTVATVLLLAWAFVSPLLKLI